MSAETNETELICAAPADRFVEQVLDGVNG
ncbi:hypothetical protein M2432_005047 [Mycobacterium sp. OTB74]|nr:hypothetical protein [Mycobacterium sp. OTB74]